MSRGTFLSLLGPYAMHLDLVFLCSVACTCHVGMLYICVSLYVLFPRVWELLLCVLLNMCDLPVCMCVCLFGGPEALCALCSCVWTRCFVTRLPSMCWDVCPCAWRVLCCTLGMSW